MKTLNYITLTAFLWTLSAQAQIVTDNLIQELNADNIGAVTDGSTWTGTNVIADLHDNGSGLTRLAATVNGGQTSSVFENTLHGAYGIADTLGATAGPITGTTVSVELWVKTGFTGNPNASQTIFETGGGGKGMTMTLGNTGSGNNTLRFALWSGGAGQVVDYTLDAAAMTNFTNDDHHQLAVTYDNLNTMKLYIDGAEVGSNIAAGVVDWDGSSGMGFWGRNGDMAYAAGLDSNGDGFGSIAVFRQYSVALSSEDVLQNYNTTIVPEPGSAALLAGCFALASVMIRRRR